MRGSNDLGKRAKGPLGEGGGLLEDAESAKRRIEFQQAWSWSGRPARADVGLARRQSQRTGPGAEPWPCHVFPWVWVHGFTSRSLSFFICKRALSTIWY